MDRPFAISANSDPKNLYADISTPSALNISSAFLRMLQMTL